MPKFSITKRPLTKETEEEVVSESVSVDIPATEGEPQDPSPYMNSDEQAALSEQVESEYDSVPVSVDSFSAAVQVVQDNFNLADRDFVVTGFSIKGSKCTVALTNGSFDLTVTIKDGTRYGII